jgi:hypothetical protein
MYTSKEPRTYFIDIDGTILTLLPDIRDISRFDCISMIGRPDLKLIEMYKEGHTIILTTARPESMRDITKKQLATMGILYHILLMNLPNGPRVLVNDFTEDTGPKAFAFNVKRNTEGIDNIP